MILSLPASSSRVLATAIYRSRNKWMYGGLLERYWTKPSKKKQLAGEITNNPARDTMRMIGQCSLIVEPHIFDVVLYGVKQTGPLMSQGQPMGPRPSQPVRPDNDYQKQPWLAQPPTYQPPPATPVWQARGTSNGKDQALPTIASQQNEKRQTYERQPVAQGYGEGNAADRPNGPAVVAPPTHVQRLPEPTVKNQVQPPHASQPPPPGPAPSSDPVIHMLAQRAGHDPQLKSVMKIVAAGEANPEQLQFFQKHIDELTTLLQTRTNAGLPPIPGPMPPRPHNFTPATAPLPSPRQPYNTGAYGSKFQPAAYVPPQNYPLKPKSSYPSSNSSRALQPGSFQNRSWTGPVRVENYSFVLVEFVGGTGDRFLLPRNSILEYLPGAKQAIVSFLLIQKYNQGGHGKMEVGKEYYETATFRLIADDSRVLAPLARVFDHPDAVRKYMVDVMDRIPRAEQVYLALRLPKDGNEDESPDDYSREDSIARSMTPVGGPVVRKPRGPYKKRVKIVEAPVEKKVEEATG